jgi:hypothetical protein
MVPVLRFLTIIIVIHYTAVILDIVSGILDVSGIDFVPVFR